MLIHGSPISQTAVADLPDLMERFWFWRGASGQKYIHSIYQPDSCPPLPGSVFVGVRVIAGKRVAMKVGRFSPFYDQQNDLSIYDEVHVHLLARGPEAAEKVKRDLAIALGETERTSHFQENEFALAA